MSAVGNALLAVIVPLMHELVETKAELIVFKEKAQQFDAMTEENERLKKRNHDLFTELELAAERKRGKFELDMLREETRQSTIASRMAALTERMLKDHRESEEAHGATIPMERMAGGE
jgi:cell division protein FtsB